MRERERAGAARDLDPPHACFSSALLLCCSTLFGSRCVRRFEMLQLASMRFRERGAGEGAPQIATQGRIFFQLAEIVWDEQHVRHQDVSDGEARGGEPFAAFEHPFELIETVHHPVVEWIFRCARHLDEPPRHGDQLHRVERRDEPLRHLRLAPWVARHQRLPLPPEMQQARTAFEKDYVAVLQKRNLPERLTREMLGPSIVEGNGAHRVVEPRFLQRPAQPDVADVAARALRHPVIGPDGQIVAGDTLIGHWLILLSSTPSARSYRAYPRRGHNISESYYRSFMYDTSRFLRQLPRMPISRSSLPALCLAPVPHSRVSYVECRGFIDSHT